MGLLTKKSSYFLIIKLIQVYKFIVESVRDILADG